MATLTVQDCDFTGLSYTTVAAGASGDEFANDGRVIFVVENGATDVNVTVTAQSTSVSPDGYGDVTVSNTVDTISANTNGILGPFPTTRFNNSSGRVAVTYDDNSNVSVAAIRLTGVTPARS